MSVWIALALLVVSLAVILTRREGRGVRFADQANDVRIVTSIYPLYEFAARLASNPATVRNLVPVGAEPHHWEPTALDLALVRQADLFAYNSPEFEQWAKKIVDGLPAGRPIVVETAQGMQVRGHAHGADQGDQLDPHVWLDPLLAKEQARRIASAMAQLAPDEEAILYERLADLEADLDELHHEYEKTLGQCRRRTLIVSHDAFSYLAARYDLEVLSAAGLSPEVEPSPARMAELIQLAKEQKIRVIFFESLVSPRVATSLANSLGAEVRVLHPLEGLSKEESRRGETYFSLMRSNLDNLRYALECD